MSKREPIDELLAVLRRMDAPESRDQAVSGRLPSAGSTHASTRTGSYTPKTAGPSLPPSPPGAVIATSLSAPLGGTSSSGTSSALTQQLQQISTQLGQLQSSNQSLIDAGSQNTQALLQNTLAKAQSGGSTLGTIASTAETFLGGGFSFAPLISGLVSLFGGGGSTPAPLTPFVLPQRIQFQGGVTGPAGQAVSAVDQNQNGVLRPYSSNAQQSPAQVTVQVQAIDSQSFLDHSQDIANAVRQALLSGGPLNDVIAEL